MKRLSLLFATSIATLLIAAPAWADKVAVLPFSSPKNVPKPELEEARKWTRNAVVTRGHVYATPDEMVSAEATIKDGTADTSAEYLAAGKAVGAQWTLVGRVERNDFPPAKLPDGTDEEGYTTYRVELEACQIGTGRVESISREVLPDEGPTDIAEMLSILLRAEGIAGAEIPWDRSGVRRPKPRPKPPQPKPQEPPPPPKEPEAPPPPRDVYGDKHPFSIGASIGISNAIDRPDRAAGPSWAMPIGAVLGYALPDAVPGLELKANVTSQVIGPRAVELSGGARYALTPFAGTRLFVGPELLLGAHVALGADQTARFLTHGSLFLAYGFTENIQAEIAGDLAAALGGSGTLILGGGTARFVVRF